MKTLFCIVLSIVLALFVAGMTGCVQSTTRTVDPVTGAVTETTTNAPAPGVLPFVAAGITAYSPRPIVVREEKSGRITAEEIANRWKKKP